MESVQVKNLLVSTSLDGIAEDGSKAAPFEFFILRDLLDEASFSQLRNDINSHIRLSPKDNDLYKFKQSKDLRTQVSKKRTTPLIQSFVKMMFEEIRPLLEKESKLKLSDVNFDITASRYDSGNYLLCHNDDMKDPTRQQARSLAFIYYLTTRPWTSSDGGALILYESDPNGEPVKVNNQIHPQPNTLVVFRTSSTSWHSVQEVFCNTDCRLSINGWFHLADPPAIASEPSRTMEPSPYEFLQPIPLDSCMEKFFEDCFNSQYLMEKTCYLIRRKFKKNSEINLPNFLVAEKFREICTALKEATEFDDNLQLVGPYNKRNYKRIKLDRLPQVCRDLFEAFRSELFFMLLSRFTGLDLEPKHLVHEKRIQDSSDDDEEEEDSGDEDEDQDNSDASGENEEDAGEQSVHESEQPTTTELGDSKDGEQSDETPGESESVTTPKKPAKRKLDCDPLTRLEFRHLEAGAYTLIHDYGYERGERSALDVILHFNHDFEVKLESGGYLSYIDCSTDSDPSEAECELLTVEPKSNSLSLVYRSDESTCRFMKYITRQHESNFQDLYCVYYERSDDLPSGALSKKLKSTDETKEGAPDESR